MSRSRDKREAQAIAYIRRTGHASALEIGQAALQGEKLARRMNWKGKEAIGLSIAVMLARKGSLTPTRGNHFRLALPEGITR